jgi:16S rRNA processing protein RimM
MVVLGRIVAPYGVAGWVKVHPFGDDPAAWRKMSRWWVGTDADGHGWQPRVLKGLRVHGKGLVAKFDGIDDRVAAEGLDGCYFGAPRAELPKTDDDEYYWGDLVGLAVVNEDGEALGSVVSLLDAGANQVLVVGDGERERLLPFVADVVKDVAVDEGRIHVAWGKDW